jgi:hypothetical protein
MGLLEILIILGVISVFLFTLWCNGMPPYKNKITFGGLVFWIIPLIGKITSIYGESYMIFIFPVSGFKHFKSMLREFPHIRITWYISVISICIYLISTVLFLSLL